MNTNRLGDIGELKVAARLTELGYVVSFPFGDARYDLVTEKDGRFITFQVKYSSLKNGAVVVRGYTVCNREPFPYDGDFDFFAAYCPETDSCYFIPANQVNTVIRLRVTEPLKPDSKIRFAKDYLQP